MAKQDGSSHRPRGAAGRPKSLLAYVRRLHRDQRGSMSMVAVFSLLLLVMLLGMMMNTARQLDHKVRMQNTADAAAYSGGVVLARGMNTLAFTNHLLADLFALTAFLREAHNGSAEQLALEILDNWERIGPVMIDSEFPKFAELGQAIDEKVPHERAMVRTFSTWAAAVSELMLPVLEDLLAEQQIPEFQRALVQATPVLAQLAADEITRRHSQSWPQSVRLRTVLWRTDTEPFGGPGEARQRTLPVVDPVLDRVAGQQQYIDEARRHRSTLAHNYLLSWDNDSLDVFQRYAKMSQFRNLWRVFSRGHLLRLLNDTHASTNLPHQLLAPAADPDHAHSYLEQHFLFVAVVYREQDADRMPGLFQNPLTIDAQAYAQIMLFVPRRRLLKTRSSSSSSGDDSSRIGVPGDSISVTPPSDTDSPPSNPDDREPQWQVTRQFHPRHPEDWDLWTQNWTTQLVPATAGAIPAILSTPPALDDGTTLNLPDLEALTEEEFRQLSHH